LIRSR